MINSLINEFKSRPIFYQIFIIFQVVSFCAWDGLFSYILFTFMSTVSFFCLYKKDHHDMFFILIVVGIFLYACYSFYAKNPNKLYENNINVEMRSYIIEDSANKGMLRGISSGGGRGLGDYNGNPLERGNYNGIIAYSKDDGKYILLSCSLLEVKGCKYHENYGDTIWVKYTYETPKYPHPKYRYVYGLRYKDDVIGDEYYINNYKAEREYKIYFIFLYLLVNFGFIFYKAFR